MHIASFSSIVQKSQSSDRLLLPCDDDEAEMGEYHMIKPDKRGSIPPEVLCGKNLLLPMAASNL